MSGESHIKGSPISRHPLVRFNSLIFRTQMRERESRAKWIWVTPMGTQPVGLALSCLSVSIWPKDLMPSFAFLNEKIGKAAAHFRLGKLIGFGWKMVMITKLNDVSDLIAGIASN